MSPGFFVAPVSISPNFGESGLFKNILVIDPGGVRVEGTGVPFNEYNFKKKNKINQKGYFKI